METEENPQPTKHKPHVKQKMAQNTRTKLKHRSKHHTKSESK